MTPARRSVRAEATVLRSAAILLFLVFLLVSLRQVLTPLPLLLALMVLLSPAARARPALAVMGVVAFLTLLWLVETIGSLLAPFVLALGLAYILDPAVDRLERKVPRGVAIGLIALPLAAVLVLLVVFGIPALAQQIAGVLNRAPAALAQLVDWLEQLQERVRSIDLPWVEGEERLLRRIRPPDPEAVAAFIQERQAEIARRAWQAVLGVRQGLNVALSVLGYLVLTPVLTFYLLRDWDGIKRRLVRLFPEGRRDQWLGFLQEYDDLLSRYLRGQLLAAAAVGVFTWLGLLLLGFPSPGVVGAVAGIFNVVPYLGLVVSLVPALIIALVSGSVLASLLKVAVVFFVVQFLDSAVVGPRIVGGSVGLHPVWVILAIAVGGFFFGFVGLLLAVPGALLIKLTLRIALKRYEGSGMYRERVPPDA